MSQAAYKIAQAFDTAILGLYSGLANSVGASDADIADSDIRRAVQYLDDNDVPQNDRNWIFKPSVFWGG